MFNKAIAEEYALEDFYTLVNDGKWTFDKFGEIIRSVSNDLNGDSVMDENDQYGLVALDRHVLPSFWIAGGVKTIEKNDADEPVFTIPTNEKFSDVFNSIFEMIRDSNSYLANIELFQQGRALFTLNTIGSVTDMREMEDDFGILPLPKYDESQAVYYTRVGGGSLPIVPITISDPDFVGAIIEALTCESKNTVIPAYYDVALKTKYVRDEASVDMLNIIFENRIYDLGDTYWCMQLRDGIFAGMFTDNNRDLSSKLASMKSTMDGLTQATIEAFED